MKAFVSKSFFRGYIRAIDIYGKKRWPDIFNDKESDYEKIKGDWENVGKSIYQATRDYGKARR